MGVDLNELRALCVRALVANRTANANAEQVAAALVAAEADGLKGHGLSRIPSYAAQARCGKVDGFAVPSLERVRPGAIRVDAGHGFAYPALSAAIEALNEAAADLGIAAAAVTRSHHFGAAGHHVERLAEAGLVALLFGNSPKAIAPWGGHVPLFGTNPIAFAAPRRGDPPLVIDLSLSKVARGRIMVAAQKGEPIPRGWALDETGEPTTDAQRALRGVMLPIGDAKGYALVLMVEILAAALTGSNFGFEASSFFDTDGPPPGVGQFCIAIAPDFYSDDRFADRLDGLIAAIGEQDHVRLPGERRLALRAKAQTEGVDVDPAVYAEIQSLAGD